MENEYPRNLSSNDRTGDSGTHSYPTRVITGNTPAQSTAPLLFNESQLTPTGGTTSSNEVGITSTPSLALPINKTSAQMKWEQMFSRLLAFKAEHGHCLVPNRYKAEPQLGSWVSTQRRQFKILMSDRAESTPMTLERATLLEAVGFVWSTRDPRHVPWEDRYRELCDYKIKHGDCLVPIGFKENIQLANWVSTQRQEFKLLRDGRPTRLTRERILLLSEIGFVWEAQRGGPRSKKRPQIVVPTEHPRSAIPRVVSGPTGDRSLECEQRILPAQSYIPDVNLGNLDARHGTLPRAVSYDRNPASAVDEVESIGRMHVYSLMRQGCETPPTGRPHVDCSAVSSNLSMVATPDYQFSSSAHTNTFATDEMSSMWQPNADLLSGKDTQKQRVNPETKCLACGRGFASHEKVALASASHDEDDIYADAEEDDEIAQPYFAAKRGTKPTNNVFLHRNFRCDPRLCNSEAMRLDTSDSTPLSSHTQIHFELCSTAPSAGSLSWTSRTKNEEEEDAAMALLSWGEN